MKSNIAIIMAVFSIAIASCSKKTERPSMSAKIKMEQFMDSEDDDRPILMHRVQKVDQSPISSANIMLIEGEDTLTEQTDASGECIFNLPRMGIWELTISHTGYGTINDNVNIVDSFTQRTDYMTEE